MTPGEAEASDVPGSELIPLRFACLVILQEFGALILLANLIRFFSCDISCNEQVRTVRKGRRPQCVLGLQGRCLLQQRYCELHLALALTSYHPRLGIGSF